MRTKKDDIVTGVLSIHIERKHSLIDLQPRSGKLAPVPSPFGGMTGEGYGSVCCLSDLDLQELVDLRDYLDSQINKRIK